MFLGSKFCPSLLDIISLRLVMLETLAHSLQQAKTAFVLDVQQLQTWCATVLICLVKTLNC
jgi:hypothetical protein